MRHTTTSRMGDVIKIYNGTGQYGFVIRGQEFRFEDREQYKYWMGRALDIADQQEKKMEHVDLQRDFDVEQALADSDTQEQFELEFKRNEDPNERLVDDVDPKHRE